jgi:hypothetical protein
MTFILLETRAYDAVGPKYQPKRIGRRAHKGVEHTHHRQSSPWRRWLRETCAPAQCVRCTVKNFKSWLVPPVLFPALLIVLFLAYWLLKAPT